MYRFRIRGTPGSNPPTDLLVREIAYSDANNRLYIGRYDGTVLVLTTDLELVPILAALDALTTQVDGLDGVTTEHANDIGTIAADLTTLELSTSAQAQTLAALTTEVETLTTVSTNLSNVALDHALELEQLSTTTSGQAQALAALTTQVGQLDTTTGDQAQALAALGATVNTLDQVVGDHIDSLAALDSLTSAQQQSIAVLLARPSGYGFTYDQASEPIGPAVGATWRERSGNGARINDWEWLGSVWAALNTTTLSESVLNGAAPAYPTLAFEAPRCLFVQCRIATIPTGNPATPFTSTSYREVFLARSNTAVAGSVFSFRPMISLAQSSYIASMNYLNPGGAFFFTGTTVVGSPGTIHAPSVSWVYREVRA